MAEIVPIPIYPSTPTGADLTAFKAAKDQLDLPYLIQPVRAVPGSPGRVVAIRKRPAFLCDYAFIPKVKVDSIREALKWALSDEYDPRAVTVVHMLKEIFGEGVKEIGVSKNPS